MSLKKLTMIAAAFVVLTVVLAANHSCYKHDVVIKSEPFLRFIVTPGNECREYCNYEAECETFSFNLDRLSECFLYRENGSTLVYKASDMQYNATSFTFGMKGCNAEHAVNTQGQSTQSFKMGQKDAVVFLRTDLKMCAEVDYTETTSSSSLGYQLFYSSACETAPQWEIVPSHLDNVFGCNLVTVKEKLRNMCLWAVKIDGITFWGESSPTAYLSPCHEIPVMNLLMCPESGSWALYQHTHFFRPIIIPVDTSNQQLSRMSMSTLFLVTGSNLKKLQNIPCNNISVIDGRILLEETVPFFIPGETITVSCNKGFGKQVTQGVFRQEFTITCSESRTPVVCSAMPEDAGLPRAQKCSSTVQIESCSSESSVTVELLAFLTCLSNFLMST